MRTDQQGSSDLINSDLQELSTAAKKLVNHAIRLGSLGFGTTFLEWVASFAAMSVSLLSFSLSSLISRDPCVHYLLILDRTHWKTNILTGLLIPYIFFSLPSLLFNIFRGQVGRWIAIIAVILRLFFPRRFPEWLEMPAAMILLIVVAPSLFSSTFRDDLVGVVICLVIACYLLQEHIRASGGFRNSFTQAHGISNTLGIIILFVYPAWAIVIHFL
ncbi:hypothetical protein SAY86_020081 [Trapa natans]|uniref:Uncharacterized protein n=1 Tax=Trapa natans TaxID=22666 RepID=A0AAN7R3V1_TRANT|nr:hypothetical protein SAY86_020081 [Trapa natans]